MIRSAQAHWEGTGKEGQGHLSTESGVLNQTPYNFRKRFEDEAGTNPEELIGAAHAGCFAMKLSFNLNGAGFTAERLDVKAEITFEGGAITLSHLILEAKVSGITAEAFAALVEDAEQNCPISKVLNTKISVTHSLIG